MLPRAFSWRLGMDSDYEEWDAVYRKYPLESLPWELGRPRRVLVDLVESGAISGNRVLDICCGAGTNAVYLAKKGFEVAGIDISSRAIEYAREKARREGVLLRLVVGNFLELPFEDGEFDFVFDMGCFHHVRPWDREKFLGEVHRVLRMGGLYLLVCFSSMNGPAWNHLTREQIIGIFSGRFRIKSIEHFSSVEGDGVTRYFYSALMEKVPVA